MTRWNERAAALPETALIIGLSLLMLLGIAQMTLIGLAQVSADGAAFVAAHTAAIDSSANVPSVVATAFPQLNANSIVATPSASNLQQAVVSKSVGGFLLLPGVASTYALSGSDVEFSPQGVNATPQPFSFGINATLKNYCPVSGACSLPSTYSVYLAQYVNTQASGNGWNGAFAEWRCHQQYLASVNFPSSRPTGGLAGSIYDPTNASNKDVEYPIYQWDQGVPCK